MRGGEVKRSETDNADIILRALTSGHVVQGIPN